VQIGLFQLALQQWIIWLLLVAVAVVLIILRRQAFVVRVVVERVDLE
jgi:hypothetical protein